MTCPECHLPRKPSDPPHTETCGRGKQPRRIAALLDELERVCREWASSADLDDSTDPDPDDSFHWGVMGVLDKLDAARKDGAK